MAVRLFPRRAAVAATAGTPDDIIETAIRADDGRSVPTRIFLPPTGRTSARLIVFSHGNFSSNHLYDALLGPWARAGYVVAVPTHVDSETNPDRSRYDPEAVLETRLADMRLMLDRVPALAGRIGQGPAIAAGHSLGALIAQMLGGATPLDKRSGLPRDDRDPRVGSVVAVSPPGPADGFLRDDSWSGLAVPMLVTTGTTDQVPRFAPDWHLHLASFERAPPNDKFAAIGQGADHYFGGVICRLTVPGPRRDDVLAAVNAIILLFLKSYAQSDKAALRRLKAEVTNPRDPLVTVRMR